jgi:hypothetical protein
VPDVDRRGREVEVSPAEGSELMDAQAGEDERGDDRETVVRGPAGRDHARAADAIARYLVEQVKVPERAVIF